MKLLEKLSSTAVGSLFKGAAELVKDNKGKFSSKRTISSLIIGYAITDASMNGINLYNTLWVVLGVLPLIVLAWHGEKDKSPDKMDKE